MQEKSETISESSKYHVPNLERALHILELLACHPEGMSLSDISNELEFPKNSVYRITCTLIDTGYLQRDPGNKRFSITRKLLALAYASISEHNLVEKALDVMRGLRDKTRETVLLGVLVGNEGMVLEQVPGLYPFKFFLDIGTRFGLHVSAPGKALVAFLPERESEAIVRTISMPRYNKRTITTRKRFAEELDWVREHGYALDRAEELEGVHCVAAPVMDQYGYPIAAIWITGPADRLPSTQFEETGRIVSANAKEISQRLGYGLL